MLYERILKFIADLSNTTDLIPCDIELQARFRDLLTAKSPQELINADDVATILECYRIRWLKVIDTEFDYTLNQEGANKLLIELSKELAIYTNKKSFQILFPTVTNTVDLNQNLPLDVDTPAKLYHANKGAYFGRKKGLGDRIIKEEYKLTSVTSYVGIGVLRRLKTSDKRRRLRALEQGELNPPIKVGEEDFVDFWDLLEKKVFNRLQRQNSMPLMSVMALLNLHKCIDTYYRKKVERLDFSRLKNTVKEFFSFFSKIDLDAVNYLYGERVLFRGSEKYLFELFIELDVATPETLDEIIVCLAEWLYQYNPLLKIMNDELTPIYAHADGVSRRGSRALSGTHPDLPKCLTFIVSLFIKSLRSGSDEVSLLDMVHSVDPESAKIYNSLKQFLETDNFNELIREYIKAITAYKTSAAQPELYRYMLDGTLNEVGVFWFQSELIFGFLLEYKQCNKVLSAEINATLDKLIHIFAQNWNPTLKQVRINAIFSEFMRTPGIDQGEFLFLMRIFDCDAVRANFFKNCSRYISSRLQSLNQVKSRAGSSFFGEVDTNDREPFASDDTSMVQVSTIIEAYKRGLGDLHLEPKLELKFAEYLDKISSPVITVAERTHARASSEGRPAFLGGLGA